MKRYFSWLQAHPVRAALITLLYYLSSVFLHVEVGGLINGIFGRLGRSTYDIVIAVLVLLILGLVFRDLYKKGSYLDQGIIRFLGIYALVGVAVSFGFLFVINIEAIHFLQYAILSFHLLALVKSYAGAMILAILCGFYDEAVQYLMLDTRATYYDFNDVFLDSLGAGMGLWLAKVKDCLVREGSSKRAGLYVLNAVLGTVLLLFILYMTGHFSLLPDPDREIFFVLLKEIPRGFWHVPSGPYARFHIMLPFPGMIMILITGGVFSLLGRVGAS